MKIAFYSTKPYDKIWFDSLNKEKYGFTIDFLESPCKEASISLARGYDAICIFVNDYVTAPMIEELYQMGVKAILLRSAGFNHVDLRAAKGKLEVLRVPSYSPEAVAEYAMAMLLTVNRYTHKAYTRTREFNMNINGLMGRDLFRKTAGIVGTGKIGQAMIRICQGFSMDVIAYDPYPNSDLSVKYVFFIVCHSYSSKAFVNSRSASSAVRENFSMREIRISPPETPFLTFHRYTSESPFLFSQRSAAHKPYHVLHKPYHLRHNVQ